MNFRCRADSLILCAAMGLTLIAAPSSAEEPHAAPATVASPITPPPPDRERARMNQRVFDSVWTEVRTQ